MTRMKWIGVVCGTGLVGMAAWTFRATPQVHVERAEVTAGTITRRVVATGTVQPVTTVDVGTQVSGMVQSLDVDFNAMVHVGQVVARLDPSLYQAALDQAQAGLGDAEGVLDQAQADLAGFQTAEKDARTQLGRAQELAANELMTDADLDAVQILMDEASANVRAGEAQVAAARAGISQAQASVDQATVNLSSSPPPHQMTR